MPHIAFYDRSSIQDLPWEKMREGDRLSVYLSTLVQEDIQSAYIFNIKTELAVLTVDDLVLPLTINAEEYENSHICSPYTHYVTATLDEIKLFNNRLLQFLIKYLIAFLSVFLKYGSINRVVTVNNWLIPTNLYPDLNDSQIKEITDFLKTKFPTHSIHFPSLNKMANNDLIEHLKYQDYKFVLSRSIYLIDGHQSSSFKSNMFKKDLALWEKSPYSPLESASGVEQKIIALYSAVYLIKHRSHNPQYSDRWVELIAKSQCWTLRVLQDRNQLDGVFAYLQIGKEMTLPFFGYDTSLPQERGLYRILSAMVATEAQKKGLLFNQSSGAASFKRLRRATPQLEYSAIYCSHLPFRQRLPWLLLRLFLNKLGAYLLRKYGI